ncbi:MAG TPA: hypothetical protein ENJ33_07115 [Thiothrix sp.]|nr:hypothetical protein [Thiothrix sp.]
MFTKKISSLTAVSVFALLLSGTALAHDGGWVASGGSVLKDSSGKCIKSSGGNQFDGCGPAKVEPPKVEKPVVVTPPAPKPTFHVLNLNEAAGSNFKTDSSELSDSARATLNDFSHKVKSSGVAPTAISIVGHTDSRGSKKYNQALSERRAESVASYLAAQGMNRDVMRVSGQGEMQPVADNATKAGRAENRRVNIHVQGQRKVQK